MSMDDVGRELAVAVDERAARRPSLHYGIVKRTSPLAVEVADSRLVLDEEDLLGGGPTEAGLDDVLVVAEMPDGDWAALMTKSAPPPTPTPPVPPGVIAAYGGDVAPDGYLMCDNGSYLRTTYQDLFDAIGTKFGAADGEHFNVPSAEDCFLIGASGTYPLGSTGGTATETLTLTQIPAHGHSFSATTGAESGHTHSVTAAGTLSGSTASESSHTHSVTAAGTLSGSTAAESSHTHSVTAAGTISGTVGGTTGSESSHSHSLGGGGGYADTGGAHDHSYWQPWPYSTVFSSGGDATANTSYQNQATGYHSGHTHSLAGSSGAGTSHSHAAGSLTFSGSFTGSGVTSGAGSSHTHGVGTLAFTGSGVTSGAGSSHTHGVGTLAFTGSPVTSGAGSGHTHSVSGTTGSEGSSGAHNNLPPYLAVNYIIKT